MPLIVLEGIDGCGKTTQAGTLAGRLRAQGAVVRQLREPGGTELGEAVRALLLAPATQTSPAAELFGYLMARAQLVSEIILPALARAELVLLDRFYHSTLAYQAYGLGLDPAHVRAAIALATGGLRPDLVLWLRLDPATAQARRQHARSADRIEARGLDYLTRVHQGYARMAGEGEMCEVDAGQAPEAVAQAVWAQVAARLPALKL